MTDTPPKQPILAALLAGLALAGLANGIIMVVDPQRWFWTVPGVANTGPLNLHFVKDIGVTFTVLALAQLGAVIWPVHRLALMVVVTLWYVGHGLLHVWDISTGCLPQTHWLIDLPGVFATALILAALTLWIFLTRRT